MNFLQHKSSVRRLLLASFLGLCFSWPVQAKLPVQWHLQASAGTHTDNQRQVIELQGNISLLFLGFSFSAGVGLHQQHDPDLSCALLFEGRHAFMLGPGVDLEPSLGFGLHLSSLTLDENSSPLLGGIVDAGLALGFTLSRQEQAGFLRTQQRTVLFFSLHYRYILAHSPGLSHHQMWMGIGVRFQSS